MATQALRSEVRPPVSPRARMLLGRADGYLSGSIGAATPSDQFLDCYTAALRGAAAVIEAAAISMARARSRNAWVLLAKAAPELESWAEYFSGYSATRAAVLAGLSRSIDPDFADDFYRQVGRFLHMVEEFIGADARLEPGVARPHSLAASRSMTA